MILHLADMQRLPVPIDGWSWAVVVDYDIVTLVLHDDSGKVRGKVSTDVGRDHSLDALVALIKELREEVLARREMARGLAQALNVPVWLTEELEAPQ